MKKKIKESRANIAKGNYKEAISNLILELEQSNSPFLNDITLLSGRLSDIERKEMQGRVEQDKINIEKIKIIYLFLNTLSDIEIEITKNKTHEVEFDPLFKEISNFSALIKNYNKHIVIKTVNKNEKIKEEKRILEIPTISAFREALKIHHKSINNWSKKISFRDLSKSKDTSKIYVELDFFLIPRKLKISKSKQEKLINIKDIFEDTDQNIVILGQPGAGKTTTMKMIIHWILKAKSSTFSKFQFPIVIRLRELNDSSNNTGIFDRILEIFGIPILSKSGYDSKKNILTTLIANFLDSLNILIIFDGYDELNDSIKKSIKSEIHYLTNILSNSKFILTSRTGDYEGYIENTSEYEISSLNNIQIKRFVNNWIQDEKKSKDLLSQIRKSPFADTTIRPLTLSHLCALYERELKIPEKPKTVYRKIVNLLLEEWDLQRSIKRGSSYSGFEVDRKFEFLSHLGYVLTIDHDTTTFSSDELANVYKLICKNFSLPIGESKKVVDEIETHTGIFIQSGFDKFEFAHKSIQEYLTAEYLVKLPIIPNSVKILKIPSEIALAVALSSNPTLYFANLIFERLVNLKFSIQFYNTLLDRLVIEKPDFYQSPELGIAISALYTKCYTTINLKGKKGGDNDNWELFFKRFVDLSKVKESIYSLKDSYFIRNDETISMSDIVETSSLLEILPRNIEKLIRHSKNNEKVKLLIKKKITNPNIECRIPNILISINIK